jgi:ferredoxin
VRVHVDPNKCQGHTLCAMVASALFELGEQDGHSHAVERDLTEDEVELARRAASNCPEEAIFLSAT